VRRLVLGLGLATLLAGAPPAALAHDAYDDSQANPLRLIAYAINPLGFGLEWLVTRPIHFLVSGQSVEQVFGHRPHENPFGGYGAYEPDLEPALDLESVE
jgi:hypothetical protein